MYEKAVLKEGDIVYRNCYALLSLPIFVDTWTIWINTYIKIYMKHCSKSDNKMLKLFKIKVGTYSWKLFWKSMDGIISFKTELFQNNPGVKEFIISLLKIRCNLM